MGKLTKQAPKKEAPEAASREASELADAELEKVSGGSSLGADPQPDGRDPSGYGWSRPNG